MFIHVLVIFVLLNALSFLFWFSLYFLGFKRFAFYQLAVCGVSGKWLSSHCPYSSGHKCRVWTCSSYSCCPKMSF